MDIYYVRNVYSIHFKEFSGLSWKTIDNLTITLNHGALSVTDHTAKFEITLHVNSGEYLYDGTKKTVSGFRNTDFEVGGMYFTVTGVDAAVTRTDAGTYPVEVTGTPIDLDAQGNDVTGQFVVETIDGTMAIQPRRVVLTSVSLEKEYDGATLTNGINPLIVSEGGFVGEEGVDAVFTGSQTNVGTCANAFNYTMKTGTKAENDEITTIYSTLEVAAATGIASLHKIDAADANTSLKGAVFALYRVGASDDILVSTYTTDGNGLIVVADLVPGMYYWKEISAPEGYLLDAQKYYFTVEISENTYMTLTNVRAPIPDVFTLDHFAYVIDYPDGTVRKSRFCSNRCTVRRKRQHNTCQIHRSV